MSKEAITKGIKGAAMILAALGIQFAPEQVDNFAGALVTAFTGIFAVIYGVEAWMKNKKGA